MFSAQKYAHGDEMASGLRFANVHHLGSIPSISTDCRGMRV